MKLNPDCIRDVLLIVEAASTSDNFVQFPEDWPETSFKAFSFEEIRYHIEQCFMSGLLIEPRRHTRDMSGHIFIRDISPSGHEFLANIREERNWKETKSLASKAGSLSLKVLESIAAGVATAFVNKQLGL